MECDNKQRDGRRARVHPDAIREMSERSGEKRINISADILQPIALQKLTDVHREHINNLPGNIMLLAEQDDLETFKTKVKAYCEKCNRPASQR
ncbi:hypothetical protein M5Y49_14770 [Escherichia coli]|nr:hypothetical protein [Escherichia coli]